MKIQTQQIAVISTSHVTAINTQIAIKLLKEGNLTGMAFEGSWLLNTEPLREVAELALPALKPLVEFFAEQGYDWINFDPNADEIEGVPAYVW